MFQTTNQCYIIISIVLLYVISKIEQKVQIHEQSKTDGYGKRDHEGHVINAHSPEMQTGD